MELELGKLYTVIYDDDFHMTGMYLFFEDNCAYFMGIQGNIFYSQKESMLFIGEYIAPMDRDFKSKFKDFEQTDFLDKFKILIRFKKDKHVFSKEIISIMNNLTLNDLQELSIHDRFSEKKDLIMSFVSEKDYYYNNEDYRIWLDIECYPNTYSVLKNVTNQSQYILFCKFMYNENNIKRKYMSKFLERLTPIMKYIDVDILDELYDMDKQVLEEISIKFNQSYEDLEKRLYFTNTILPFIFKQNDVDKSRLFNHLSSLFLMNDSFDMVFNHLTIDEILIFLNQFSKVRTNYNYSEKYKRLNYNLSPHQILDDFILLEQMEKYDNLESKISERVAIKDIIFT